VALETFERDRCPTARLLAAEERALVGAWDAVERVGHMSRIRIRFVERAREE
jgi:hypothetical protein